MMCKVRHVLLFALVMVFNQIYSQSFYDSAIAKNEIYVGIGKGNMGYAYTIGFSKVRHNFKITKKISGIEVPGRKRDDMIDGSILLGKQFQGGRLTSSISGGLGIVKGRELSAGWSFESQFYKTPNYQSQQNFSYGLNIFAMLGREYSYGGITLMINLIHERFIRFDEDDFDIF